MPITIWLRYSKEKMAWEHNHIEDGNASGSKPKGHPSWSKYEWRKCLMQLEKGRVI